MKASPKGYDFTLYRQELRACKSAEEVDQTVERWQVMAGDLAVREQFWKITAEDAPFLSSSMGGRLVLEGASHHLAHNPAASPEVRDDVLGTLTGDLRDEGFVQQLLVLAREGWIARGSFHYLFLETRLRVSPKHSLKALDVLVAVPGTGTEDYREWLSFLEQSQLGLHAREIVASEMKDAPADFYRELLRGPWTDELFEELAEAPAARQDPALRQALRTHALYRGGSVLRRLMIEARPKEVPDLLEAARLYGGVAEVSRCVAEMNTYARQSVPQSVWADLLSSEDAQVRLDAIRMKGQVDASAIGEKEQARQGAIVR